MIKTMTTRPKIGKEDLLYSNLSYGPFRKQGGEAVIDEFAHVSKILRIHNEIVWTAAARLAERYPRLLWRWYMWKAIPSGERLVALIVQSHIVNSLNFINFRVDLREKNEKKWTSERLVAAISAKVEKKLK